MIKSILMASVAAIALTAAPVGVNLMAAGGAGIQSAQAEEGGSKGGQGGKGYRGGRGEKGGSSDHDSDSHGGVDVDESEGHTDHDDGSDHGSKGKKGSGGSGSDHAEGDDHSHDDGGEDGADHGGKGSTSGAEGRGGNAQRDFESGDSRSGGRPVWAQEGIPEVELGRLNVVRGPGTVLDHAVTEALSNLTTERAALYSMSAEEFAALVANDYDNVDRIDSPLENIGLYRDLMKTGAVPPGVTPVTTLDLAAILFGGASDKTIPVTADRVLAINTILGVPALSEADTQALAAKAETVRAGILTGHGEEDDH
ncbi:hypothetical protein [Minwuia thermotolerans]|uniref:Uncharacterized protein n=1 Tax=Minwuia thermotolerans TaxID=2056226 RepID=A0A2M9G1X7_9PROT|nr:hypothetical protein [Minwuia thermotolerans]PJK29722.1 hypothetical protein CVT23_11830 [Minwuia thermotolerans]